MKKVLAIITAIMMMVMMMPFGAMAEQAEEETAEEERQKRDNKERQDAKTFKKALWTNSPQGLSFFMACLEGLEPPTS